MTKNRISRLHWKLFFPLVGLLWIVIGITILYFVAHERQRLSHNLGNRLVNVNTTIIDAYNKGADLQTTVDFIRLFTNQTTLEPLHITVYDNDGNIIADNNATTIPIHNESGQLLPAFKDSWTERNTPSLHDMTMFGSKYMVSSAISGDGTIHTFAALPYKGEVLEFLSIDSVIWIVVFGLGVLSFILAYFSSKAICRNVYALRDFAEMISSNDMPDDIESWHFSKDELGDVSKRLVLLYKEKLKAEEEKLFHERQIGVNVSHELNTPVAIIKGYLDTIRTDENISTEQKNKFIIRASDNIDRLADLIDDLNSVMRIQENKIAIVCKDFDFQSFIIKLFDDVKHNHKVGNMALEMNIPAGCMVKGNEGLLNNALFNLIVNSVKHSCGKLISIKFIGEEDDYLVFSYSDDGIGVENEHLERLFDLFYRVDTGRSRKNGGSGLGLSLVKRIFVAMNGDITAKNLKTGGLEFIFKLPKGK